MKKERLSCRRNCGNWNAADGDCELMGLNHLTPRTCPVFKQLYPAHFEEVAK